jgi:hypothetical protein
MPHEPEATPSFLDAYLSRRTALLGAGALAGIGLLGSEALGLTATESAQAVAQGAWGGYANGQIPLTAMTYMGVGQGGGNLPLYLRPDAAASMLEMQAAYHASTGDVLPFIEAYRDLGRQVTLWNAYQNGTGNVAAKPGYSNHGWGEAVDFTISDQRFAWLQANAGGFGWDWYTGARSGPERWHWEFNGGYVSAPAPSQLEEQDMIAVIRRPVDGNPVLNGFVAAVGLGAVTAFSSTQEAADYAALYTPAKQIVDVSVYQFNLTIAVLQIPVEKCVPGQAWSREADNQAKLDRIIAKVGA